MLTFRPVKSSTRRLLIPTLLLMGFAAWWLWLIVTVAAQRTEIEANVRALQELQKQLKAASLEGAAPNVIEALDAEILTIRKRTGGLSVALGHKWEQLYILGGLSLVVAAFALWSWWLAQRARREAEAASEARGRFLADVSHELRGPLNGVIGIAQAMRRGPLEGAQREQMRVIHHSGEAALRMLNDLLDLAKMEAGALEVNPQPFRVDDLLDHIETLHRALAIDRGLQLGVSRAAGTPEVLVADSVRIGQVLGNLVSNAIRFTPEGSVSVEAGYADGTLILRVSDTGVGMTAEAQARVFSRFAQGGADTARRYGGTGLGLSIAREIVGLLEGAITLDSAPERGSTFEVCIPATAGQLAPRRPASGRFLKVEPRSGRLLVVDDSEINRLAARALLESMGYEVDEATDGGVAVTAHSVNDYLAILMDVNMPGMDGFEATRQIRAGEAGQARTPIFMMSASIDAMLEAENLGMDGSVRKPLDADQLTAALASAEAIRAKLG